MRNPDGGQVARTSKDKINENLQSPRSAVMATENVYVPHLCGTVLGSHSHRPWIADTAADAAAVPWRGQPVFTGWGEAFGWLTHARAGAFRLLDFAVARVDADTHIGPYGERRVHLRWAALVNPHHQVLRASVEGPGPNASVLNALHTGVHENAARRWTSPASRADIGRDPVTDLVHTVWERTYPLALRDAQQVLARRVDHAARLLLSDPDPRLDLDQRTRAGLAALTRAADRLTAGTAAGVPAPEESVVFDAGTVAGDQRRGGWRHAVDRVWAQALFTAAADGLITATAALAHAWDSRTAAASDADGGSGRPAGTEQAVTAWLRRTLADTNQTVLGEWLHATGRHPDAPAPAAGRAYPQLSAITVATTVDAGAVPAAAPLVGAVAAPVRAGRAR